MAIFKLIVSCFVTSRVIIYFHTVFGQMFGKSAFSVVCLMYLFRCGFALVFCVVFVKTFLLKFCCVVLLVCLSVYLLHFCCSFFLRCFGEVLWRCSVCQSGFGCSIFAVVFLLWCFAVVFFSKCLALEYLLLCFLVLLKGFSIFR